MKLETTDAPHVSALFSLYVDDQLAAEEVRRFEVHLRTCDSCLDEYERFADAVSLVRELPPARAPAHFTRRVLARSRHARRRRVAFERGLGLYVPVEVAIPLLLIAAVVALALLLID